MAEHPGGAVTEHRAGEPVHPTVRHERSDVEPRGIVLFAVSLLVGLVVIMFGLVGLFDLLFHREQSRKATDLPPAFVDDNRPPPEPRLEEIDDLNEGRFEMWPRRAARLLAPETKQLEQADPREKTMAIDEAIKGLLRGGLLRARPMKGAEAPASSTRRLPSKAAAGRTFTGGSE